MRKLFAWIILLFISAACKEKYIAPVQPPSAGYLVVEGFINSGSDVTSITLTRSTRLYDSVDVIYEHNATVNVEGENNEIFPLYENGNGVYISASPLGLNNNEKYRLQIKTQNNKEYASDFATVRHTPGIDSVTWKMDNGGIRIYVSTHDPQNNTRYYKWDCQETWEFHSAFTSTLKYFRDPATNKILGVTYRDPVAQSVDSTIYKCWQSDLSKNITIGTSEKLTADVIYLPILYVEPASEKVSVLYSVLVKQYALSQDGYLFYKKIQKNTEDVGSLFDPQPSELQGNIHCITNPSETVIGFVDISEEKNSRIFIGNSEVPGWNFQHIGCEIDTILNNPASIEMFGQISLPTTQAQTMGATIISFYASEESCVDCTLNGTNIKPSYWP
jgi:Domain of unknown function (DUF4249)